MADQLTDKLRQQILEASGSVGSDSLTKRFQDNLSSRPQTSSRTYGGTRAERGSPGAMPASFMRGALGASPTVSQAHGFNDESTVGSIVRGAANFLYGALDGATLGLLDVGVRHAGLDDELANVLGDDTLAKTARGIGNVGSIIIPYGAVARAVNMGVRGGAKLVQKATGAAIGSTREGIEFSIRRALTNQKGDGATFLIDGKTMSVADAAKEIAGRGYSKTNNFMGMKLLETGRIAGDDAAKAMHKTYSDFMGGELQKILGKDTALAQEIIDESFKFMTNGGWKHVNSMDNLISAGIVRAFGVNEKSSALARHLSAYSADLGQQFTVNLGMSYLGSMVQDLDRKVNPDDYIAWGFGENYNRFVGEEDRNMFMESLKIASVGALANRIGGGLDQTRMNAFWNNVLRPRMMKGTENKYKEMVNSAEGRIRLGNVLAYKSKRPGTDTIGFSFVEDLGISNSQKILNMAGQDMGEEAAKRVAQSLTRYDKAVRKANDRLFMSDTAKDLVGSLPRILADGALNYMFLMPEEIKNSEDQFDMYLDILHGAFLSKARGKSSFDISIHGRNIEAARESYGRREDTQALLIALSDTYNLDQMQVNRFMGLHKIYDQASAVYGSVMQDTGAASVVDIMDAALTQSFTDYQDETVRGVTGVGTGIAEDASREKRISQMNADDPYFVENSEDYNLVKIFYDQLYAPAKAREYVDSTADPAVRDEKARALEKRVNDGHQPWMPLEYMRPSDITRMAESIRNTQIEMEGPNGPEKRYLREIGDGTDMMMAIQERAAINTRSRYIDFVQDTATALNAFLEENGISSKAYGLRVEPHSDGSVVVYMPAQSDTPMSQGHLSYMRATLAQMHRLGMIEVVENINNPNDTYQALQGRLKAMSTDENNVQDKMEGLLRDQYDKLTYGLMGGKDNPYYQPIPDARVDTDTGLGMKLNYPAPILHDGNDRGSLFLNFYQDWAINRSRYDLVNIATGRNVTGNRNIDSAIQASTALFRSPDGKILRLSNLNIERDVEVDDGTLNGMLTSVEAVTSIMYEGHGQREFSGEQKPVKLSELMKWHTHAEESGMMRQIGMLSSGFSDSDTFLNNIRELTEQRRLGHKGMSPMQLSMSMQLLRSGAAILDSKPGSGGLNVGGMRIISATAYRNILTEKGLTSEAIDKAMADYERVIQVFQDETSRIGLNMSFIEGDSIQDTTIDGESLYNRVAGIFTTAIDGFEQSKVALQQERMSIIAGDLASKFGEAGPTRRIKAITDQMSESVARQDTYGLLAGVHNMIEIADTMASQMRAVGNDKAADEINNLSKEIIAYKEEIANLHQQIITSSGMNPDDVIFRSESAGKEIMALVNKMDPQSELRKQYMKFVNDGKEKMKIFDVFQNGVIGQNVQNVYDMMNMFRTPGLRFGTGQGSVISAIKADQARYVINEMMQESGNRMDAETDLFTLITRFMNNGNPDDVRKAIDMIERNTNQAVWTPAELKTIEDAAAAKGIPRHEHADDSGNYSLSKFIAEFDVVDSSNPNGLFLKGGTVNEVFIARIAQTLRVYSMSTDPQASRDPAKWKRIKDSMYRRAIDELRNELYQAALGGRIWDTQGRTPDPASVQQRIDHEILPNILQIISTRKMVDTVNYNIVDGQVVVSMSRSEITSTGARARFFDRAEANRGKTPDGLDRSAPVFMFQVNSGGKVVGPDGRVRTVQSVIDDADASSAINGTSDHVFDNSDIGDAILSGVGQTEVFLDGQAYDLNDPRQRDSYHSKLASMGVEISERRASQNIVPRNQFVMISVSPKQGVAFPRSVQNLKNLQEMAKNEVSRYEKTIDKMVADNKMTQAQGETAKKAMQTLFSEALNSDPDAFVAINNTTLQAMVRTLYMAEQDTYMFFTELGSGKTEAELGAGLTKTEKYAGTTESVAAKELGDAALFYAQDVTHAGDPDMQMFIDRVTKRGFKVGVVADEADVDSPASRHPTSGRGKTVQQYTDRANASAPNSLAQRIAQQNKVWAEDNSGTAPYANLGASTTNGVTYMSHRMAKLIFGVKGANIGDDVGGVKAVVDYNDSNTGSTVIGKTNFVYDPRIANEMDSSGVDLLMGESAAKVWGMGVGKADLSGLAATTGVDAYGQALQTGRFANATAMLPASSVKLSFSKKGKEASWSTSTTNFTDAHAMREFATETRMADQAQEYMRMVDEVMSGSDAGRAFMREILSEADLADNDPTGIAAAAIMVRHGAGADNPIVRSYILRKMSDSALKNLTRLDSKRYPSRISVLRPGDDLAAPLFAQYDPSGTNGKYLFQAGESRKSHAFGAETLQGAESATYVSRMPSGQDMIIQNDRGVMSAIDPRTGQSYSLKDKEGLRRAMAQNGSADHAGDADALEAHLVAMEGFRQQINAHFNPGALTQRQLHDILHNNDGQQDRFITDVARDAAHEAELRNSFAVLSRMQTSLGNIDIRIPRKNASDPIMTRVAGFMSADDGNMVEMNHFDLAVRMEGDFDVDTSNTFSSVPFAMTKAYMKYSGMNLAAPAHPEIQAIVADIFNNGNSTRSPLGSGSTMVDGLSQFRMNRADQQMLTGQLAKLQRTMTAMQAAGYNLQIPMLDADGSYTMRTIDFNNKEEFRAFLGRFGQVMQSVLDNWKTPWRGLNDPDLVQKMMFGGRITDGDGNQLDMHIEGTSDFPAGYEGIGAFVMVNNETQQRHQNVSPVHMDIGRAVYREFAAMQTVLGDVYESGERRAPTHDDVISVKERAERFFRDPNREVFMKLFAQYTRQNTTESRERRNELLKTFLKGAEPELRNRVLAAVNGDRIDYEVINDFIDKNLNKTIVKLDPNGMGKTLEGMILQEMRPASSYRGRVASATPRRHLGSQSLVDALNSSIDRIDMHNAVAGDPRHQSSSDTDAVRGVVERITTSLLDASQVNMRQAENKYLSYGMVEQALTRSIERQEGSMDYYSSVGDADAVIQTAQRIDMLKKVRSEVYQRIHNSMFTVGSNGRQAKEGTRLVNGGQSGRWLTGQDLRPGKKQYVYRIGNIDPNNPERSLELVGIVEAGGRSIKLNPNQDYAIRDQMAIVQWSDNTEQTMKARIWERITNVGNRVDYLGNDSEQVKFYKDVEDLKNKIDRFTQQRSDEIRNGVDPRMAVAKERKLRAEAISLLYRTYSQRGNPDRTFLITAHLLRPHTNGMIEITEGSNNPQLVVRENLKWQQYLAEFIGIQGRQTPFVEEAYSTMMRLANDTFRQPKGNSEARNAFNDRIQAINAGLHDVPTTRGTMVNALMPRNFTAALHANVPYLNGPDSYMFKRVEYLYKQDGQMVPLVTRGGSNVKYQVGNNATTKRQRLYTNRSNCQ